MLSPAYESFVNDIACELFGFGKKKDNSTPQCVYTSNGEKYTPSTSEINEAKRQLIGYYEWLSDKFSKEYKFNFSKSINKNDFVKFTNAEKFYDDNKSFKSINYYFTVTPKARKILDNCDSEMFNGLEVIKVNRGCDNGWDVTDNLQ